MGNIIFDEEDLKVEETGLVPTEKTSMLAKAGKINVDPDIVTAVGGAGVEVALAAACPPLAIASVGIKVLASITVNLAEMYQNIVFVQEQTKQIQAQAKRDIRLAEEKTKQVTVEQIEKTKQVFMECQTRIQEEEIKFERLKADYEQRQFEIMSEKEVYYKTLDKATTMLNVIVDNIKILQENSISENSEQILKLIQESNKISEIVSACYKSYRNGGK